MTSMWGGGGHYEQWVTFLARWAAGERIDPAGLPVLVESDLAGETWERLARRLTEAVAARLRAWAEAVSAGIGEARDEFEVSRALATARAGLAPIRTVAGHGALPAELVAKLSEAVADQVRAAQRSLEEQVDRMRRDGVRREVVEARLRTIRDNPLTAAAPADPWYRDPGAPVRRQVIVQPTPPAR